MSAGQDRTRPESARAAESVLQLLQHQHPRPVLLWQLLEGQQFERAQPGVRDMVEQAGLPRVIDRACASLADGLMQPEGRAQATQYRELAHSAIELGAGLPLLRDIAEVAEARAVLQGSAPLVGLAVLQARGAVRVRHGCVYLTGRHLSGATPAAPAAGQ